MSLAVKEMENWNLALADATANARVENNKPEDRFIGRVFDALTNRANSDKVGTIKQSSFEGSLVLSKPRVAYWCDVPQSTEHSS